MTETRFYSNIKNQFKDTKGVIIDLRENSSINLTNNYDYWLKNENSPFCIFTYIDNKMPGNIKFGDFIKSGPTNKSGYRGKVIVLVNSNTQSHGEFSAMSFASNPNARVIGSQTAGADGNMSTIILPGGIKTSFSGVGILYPDKTETQRCGVKIDKVVNQSIKGIKEGRDEVLEEAMRLIKINRE